MPHPMTGHYGQQCPWNNKEIESKKNGRKLYGGSKTILLQTKVCEYPYLLE